MPLLLALLAATSAVSVLLPLLVIDRGSPHGQEDVPTWRAVVGFSVSRLGLLVMVVGLVLHVRGIRRTRAWSSPMHLLTRRQHKDLLHQVRGRAPVVPSRVPLARHLAELLLVLRLTIVSQAGLLVNVAGLSIADPEGWRLAAVALVTDVLVGRDTRRARRFLGTHPDVRE